ALVLVEHRRVGRRRLRLPFDDHDLGSALEVDDHARVARDRASLPRLGAAAEDERATAPERPDRRRVRAARRHPVVVRLREPRAGSPVQTVANNPYRTSFAMRIASFSSSNGIAVTTGPKISSCATSIALSTFARTVGW